MISIFLIPIDTAAAVRVLSSLVIEKKAKGVIPRVIREIFFSIPLSLSLPFFFVFSFKQ